MSTLAERQAAVVAALVAGGTVPAGFSDRLVRATRTSLLRKRAGEVAGAWPLLAASHGSRWILSFAAWADGRPPAGSLRDGWDFARSLGPDLPALAAEELAAREARLRYDGDSTPRPRRRPAIRRQGSVVAVQAFGRVRVFRV